MRDYIEAFHLIQDIERKNDVWKWQVDGVHIWPLIKFRLNEQLVDSRFEKKIWQFIIYRLKHYNPLNLLRSLIDLYTPINAKEVAFSNPSARRNYRGAQMDMIFDPLEKERKGLVIFEWPTPIPHFKRNYTKRKQLRFLDSMALPIDIMSFAWSKIKYMRSPLKQNIFPHKTIRKIAREQVVQFLLYRKAFDKLFKRNKKIKTLYLRSLCNVRHMALIAAARLNNIKTIELQHGSMTQHNIEIMYTKMPKDSSQEDKRWVFTDELWLYNDAGKKLLLDNSVIYKKKQLKLYSFMKNLRGMYQKIPVEETYKTLRIKKYHQQRKKVLFTSEEPQRAASLQFFKKLLADKEFAKEYILLYKLHPAEVQNLEFYDELKKHENFYLVDNAVGIYELFNIADVHSSYISTCIYESFWWGIPNILLHSEYSKDLTDIQKKQGVDFVKNPLSYLRSLKKFEKTDLSKKLLELGKKFYL